MTQLNNKQIVKAIEEILESTNYSMFHKRVEKLEYITTVENSRIFVAKHHYGQKIAFEVKGDKVRRLSLMDVFKLFGFKPTNCSF